MPQGFATSPIRRSDSSGISSKRATYIGIVEPNEISPVGRSSTDLYSEQISEANR